MQVSFSACRVFFLLFFGEFFIWARVLGVNVGDKTPPFLLRLLLLSSMRGGRKASQARQRGGGGEKTPNTFSFFVFSLSCMVVEPPNTFSSFVFSLSCMVVENQAEQARQRQLALPPYVSRCITRTTNPFFFSPSSPFHSLTRDQCAWSVILHRCTSEPRDVTAYANRHLCLFICNESMQNIIPSFFPFAKSVGLRPLHIFCQKRSCQK